MENNNSKIRDIANDDLMDISFFLGKIKAAADSTHSYLDCLILEPNERKNNVLYMLDIIEDLTDMADENLLKIIKKLYAICKETNETEAAK